jgi:hypothetical protein
VQTTVDLAFELLFGKLNLIPFYERKVANEAFPRVGIFDEILVLLLRCHVGIELIE